MEAMNQLNQYYYIDFEVQKINANNNSKSRDRISCNPDAIFLLKENQKYFNWDYLCLNPNAIDILTQNVDKIKWFIYIWWYDYTKFIYLFS